MKGLCRESGLFRVIGAVVVAAGMLAGLRGAVASECDEDIVHPPEEIVHGKSTGEWAALFWQWGLGIPLAEGPWTDPTGTRCGMDQDGPVFFLPGALLGGAPIILDQCVVRCDLDILVPIMSFISWAPGDCPPADLTGCRTWLDGALAQVDGLSLVVDGTQIRCMEDHLGHGPEFIMRVPVDNALQIGEPLERTFLVAGYHVILKPLGPGRHTVVSSSTVGDNGYGPLTYELTVLSCSGARFRRGDTDGSAAVNLTDAVVVLLHLFQGGEALRCEDAGDTNDDGGINITDAVFLLNHLFQSGPGLPAPGIAECGEDATDDDALGCVEGC